MKSSGTWETDVSNNSTPNEIEERPIAAAEESPTSVNKIETLKELTFRILREVQSMREVNAPSIDSGVDFYAEVTRFEVDLITRALAYTGGHQGRAARLLNLKITTLNSKIKHYGIQIGGFTSGLGGLTGSMTREPHRHDASSLANAVL